MNREPTKARYAGFDTTERDINAGRGFVSVHPATALEMFRSGLDTKEIAAKLSKSEAFAYNLVSEAREAERAR